MSRLFIGGAAWRRAADEEGHRDWRIDFVLLAAVKTARCNVAAAAGMAHKAGRQISGRWKAAALAAPLCGLHLSLRNEDSRAQNTRKRCHLPGNRRKNTAFVRPVLIQSMCDAGARQGVTYQVRCRSS